MQATHEKKKKSADLAKGSARSQVNKRETQLPMPLNSTLSCLLVGCFPASVRSLCMIDTTCRPASVKS